MRKSIARLMSQWTPRWPNLYAVYLCVGPIRSLSQSSMPSSFNASTVKRRRSTTLVHISIRLSSSYKDRGDVYMLIHVHIANFRSQLPALKKNDGTFDYMLFSTVLTAWDGECTSSGNSGL